ncbi:MAG: LamG domain-containing protein [Anaerolineaceae bacterium]|nr:LamG domain-containing protein [Anaerolineaceae bacterium]
MRNKRKNSNFWVTVVISALTVGLILTNTQALASVLGMITYWKFDDGTGAVATDSQLSYDGTIYGASWTTGVVGNALSFDGLDDYVAFNTSAFVNTTNDFSYSVWLKFNEAITGTCIGDDNEYDQMLVSLNDGPYLYLGTSGRLISKTVKTDDSWMILKTNRCSWASNTWYHIAVTLSAGEYMIYVNGNLENEVEGGPKKITGDSFNVKLGKMHYLDDFYFSGVMDELAVYNMTLSASEIKRHYQNGLIGLGYQEEANYSYLPLVIQN